MPETLTYEIKNQVAVITFTRPETYNPLDETSGLEFVEALEAAGADPEVRVVIITGQGKAFSAGGNVKRMYDYVSEHPGQGASPMFARLVDLLNRSVLAIRQMPKPVIAAVGGVAAGGGLGWVLAADIILASSEAKFDTAYIRIAVSPDGGNTFFLPRLVGPWQAAELFFRGKAIGADEARRVGLINRIIDPDRLMPEALALAQELIAQPAETLARTKALLNTSLQSSLADQLEYERQCILASVDEPEFEARIKAFFAKKKR